MGAPITDETTLGKRCKPIRTRFNRLLRRLIASPPPGVTVGRGGGSHHLSPTGWLAKDILRYAGEHGTTLWISQDVAGQALRRFSEGGSLSHRRLDFLVQWMNDVEARLTAPPVVEHPGVPEAVEASQNGSHEAAGAPDDEASAWMNAPLGPPRRYSPAELRALEDNVPSNEFEAAKRIADTLMHFQPEAVTLIMQMVGLWVDNEFKEVDNDA